MSSLEEEIDRKIEEKELKAVKGHDDKVNLKKAELLGIRFITSEKGAELLNALSRIFDLVDVPQKCGNVEVMNAEYDIQKTEYSMQIAEEIENLTFYDGVILVWEIIDRVIDEYFDEDEKDAFGYRYDLGLMDKMQDILSNEILNKIENLRKERLHELFIMKSDLYKRPAWMRNKTRKNQLINQFGINME